MGFWVTAGSFLLLQGISQTWLFASFAQGPSLHSHLMVIFALFCVLAFALFYAFLYPTVFRATMFESCMSHLSFFAFRCFRELLIEIEALCLQQKSMSEHLSNYKQRPSASKSAMQREVFKTHEKAPRMRL